MKEDELKKETSYLEKTLKLLDKRLKELGGNLEIKESSIQNFQRLTFKEIGSMDKYEIQSNLLSSDMEVLEFERKSKYLMKLLRIKDNPYFGRIDFLSDKLYQVYIGITYLTDDNNCNLIYDWRSPIASLFYQNEIGETSYQAPLGKVSGNLILKRQYKIRNRKLIHVFDNNLNITDELLESVLALNSDSKMRNIVNTIQAEQNDIIRNLTDKNLIVEGIAGSGKTSVALHRIAYLLYQIESLKSSNILIFSPNDIFSTYISNVLPELGEDNTLETTFSSFQSSYIKEYKNVENFTSFIARYYQDKDTNKNLIKIKQSDLMITLIDDFVVDLENQIKFYDDYFDTLFFYKKEELNQLYKRYSKLTLFARYKKMSEYICNQNNLPLKKYGRKIITKLYELSNFNPNLKLIYESFYQSKYFQNIFKLTLKEIKSFTTKKEISYEDSLLFIYLKGKLTEFPYSNQVLEIVVDEAQDYNKLQYIILKKIFKRASFTILGDVNQTINPYYKYETLNDLQVIFDESKYLKLTKTYRSSKEIIDYANKILNLNYVVAIRKKINKKVLIRESEDLNSIKKDLNYGIKNYKRVAIITKDDFETNNLYNELKTDYDISNILASKIKNPNLLITPAYLAKGLEFDFVIIYTTLNNHYNLESKYLFYVAVTRCQHELIVYNQEKYFLNLKA